MQDMLPADGSVYMPNMDTTMGSMMKALREWEKKRGISYNFKGKFIENRPMKKVEEKPKAKDPVDRPIKVPRDKPAVTVPRDRHKPGRKATFTKEERRQRKNEFNRLYAAKNKQEARQRSKDWRAKQSPEQRAEQLQRVRDWKAAKKAERLAAANATSSVQEAGLPLADAPVS
jgi:hypothetical protein